MRQSDLFGRYSGEEFVILLPETNPAGAINVAERLRAAVDQQHVQFDDHDIHITVSLGVVSKVSFEKTSLDVLYACVDQAVYQAKSAGRNCVQVCSTE